MLVEVTTFRLVDGADEAAFLQADAQAQETAMLGSPRALRRTTARGEDGGWLVLVLWDDVAAGPDPVLAGWAEPSSVTTSTYRAL